MVGIFKKDYLIGLLATVGVVLAAAYMLWLAKRVIFGVTTNRDLKVFKDLNAIEISILSILALLTIIFGFWTDPIFNTISVSVDNVIMNYEQNLNKNLISGL